MTTRPRTEQLESLSLILKEQSVEVKYVGVFTRTYPIATFENMKMRGS